MGCLFLGHIKNNAIKFTLMLTSPHFEGVSWHYNFTYIHKNISIMFYSKMYLHFKSK